MFSYVTKSSQRKRWLWALLVETGAGPHMSNNDEHVESDVKKKKKRHLTVILQGDSYGAALVVRQAQQGQGKLTHICFHTANDNWNRTETHLSRQCRFLVNQQLSHQPKQNRPNRKTHQKCGFEWNATPAKCMDANPSLRCQRPVLCMPSDRRWCPPHSFCV